MKKTKVFTKARSSVQRSKVAESGDKRSVSNMVDINPQTKKKVVVSLQGGKPIW